jgi:hypothetical protein
MNGFKTAGVIVILGSFVGLVPAVVQARDNDRRIATKTDGIAERIGATAVRIDGTVVRTGGTAAKIAATPGTPLATTVTMIAAIVRVVSAGTIASIADRTTATTARATMAPPG